jgi:small-conductance mechanosensitive channel
LARVDAQLEMIKAWFAISQRRLLHNIEDQNKRLASFNAQKNELERQIEEYKNKNIALVQQASMLNHVVTHIQQYLAAKNGDKKYHDLRRAVEALRKQQSNFDQLAKIYSAIIPVKVELNNYLDLVIQKLNSTSSVFQRSAGAITLEGIKSVLVDIKFFADFAFSIVSTASVLQVVAWCKDLLGDFVALLNLLFVLVLALAVYFAGLIALPLAQQRVIAFEQQHAATLLSNFMRALLQFVYTKLVGIVCWLVLFYLIRYDWAVTIGPSAKVIFYVSSIFYLSFLLGAFKRLYLTNNSLMLQKDFMRRFVMVAQLFLAVTVITYFLSEALITIVYGHSALSRTLWAIYSLVARALIIFLIMDKHVILGLIPERGAVWAMVRQQVDRYYYLFLLFAIALIVLSDPFIGYGLLVTTVLKAALLTIGLLVVLYWVHEFLKQNSSQLFFASSGEQVRERFAHSKTWYALFIIVSFSALIIGAILLFARIWGHAISLQTIANFFDIEIVPVQGDIAGTKISITLRSLLTVVGFIFAGFLLSSLFNRYVLQRIYLLLHVNAGVQNTITRVSGYLFIIIPLIFGLQRAGLGSWIPSLGVLLMLGIAWAVKGPADDFFAYFIILVERSIKIGDYIRVESLRGDISGVVRKITPRSVVLRRRNSYAVIVPNSKLLRTYVYNWNYSHNYFGFDDIFVTVGFDADQDKVREILLDILDNNPHVLKNPPPIIRIDNFTINGYEILIRAFLPTTEVLNQWDIRSDVRFAILREFKKHNIKLAAPIQGIKLDINKSTDDQ